VRQEATTIRRLARVSELIAESGDGEPGGAGIAVLPDGTTVAVPLGDLIDLDRECARLGSELDRLLRQVQGQETKLTNQQFLTRAPAAVVAREREKLASWQGQMAVLQDKRRQLGCGG
jgi:valyl-tRNA synthetase